MVESDFSVPNSLNLNQPEEEEAETHRRRWTPEEDDHLKALVQRLGTSSWDIIASSLPGRTETDCKYRFKRVLDPDLVKGFWTREEDAMLIDFVSKFGNQKWARIAKYLKGRSGKQCRERWHNHLDPCVNKDAWTIEEEILVSKAHRVMGTRWSKIAKLLPGRTDNAVKNRWYSSLRHRIALGSLVVDDEPLPSIQLSTETTEEDQAAPSVENDDSCDASSVSDSVSDSPEDIYTRPLSTEPDFSCDVVLDSDPVLVLPEEGCTSVWTSKRKRKLGMNKDDGPGSTSGADAVLQMIAQDMLPLSLVEGSGFQGFVAAFLPRGPRLSQRSLGLRLYDAVEKGAKPRLIRQLRDCRTVGAESANIHVTADVWAGEDADLVLAVRLHFLDDSWTVCRPTVAFRRLHGRNLKSLLSQELEAVLLSYGLFPENVGYVVVHDAKATVAAHDLFCDYKFMHVAQNHDPEEDELVDFLDDQVHVDGLSEILLGTHLDCMSSLLQAVLKEALKSCRAASQVLAQLRDVVLFFRRNVHWNELLPHESGISLAGPSSHASYAWNSTFASIRALTSESTWRAVQALLSHGEADGPDVPVLHVDREQAADIVGLLEPFEEATRVLQGDWVTFSLVIPSVIGIDHTLATRPTNHAAFCRALRTGLRHHFQPLIINRDLILATALDPRIKLHPFVDDACATVNFLIPPTQRAVRSILESALSQVDTWIPVEQDSATPDCEDQRAARAASLGSITSKKVFRLERPAAPGSELDRYLSEPLLDGDPSVEAFWKAATRFPRLRSLSHRLLAVPVSSGGFNRLYPQAASIVRAHRNRLPQHTTERLLLYREFNKT